MSKVDCLSFDELLSDMRGMGEKDFRARQLYSWIFRKSSQSFQEMTDLAVAFREKLISRYSFTELVPVSISESVKDGCLKILFRLEDSHHIESVLMSDGDRVSGCISSQVGCKMGCTFCSTARMGFIRDLTPGEIYRQVAMLNLYAYEKFGKKMTNLVFMGMGEPLDNFHNLKKALEFLTSDGGLGMSHRRVTISTCGLIPEMFELMKLDRAPNIAVSLNAPSQSARKEIMPISNRYPLEDLLEALRSLPLKKRNRVTVEYVILKDVNDSLTDAAKLAKALKGVPCKINLIGYNDCDLEFSSPDYDSVLKFQELLIASGYTTFIRKSLGEDINGACGQLFFSAEGEKATI